MSARSSGDSADDSRRGQLTVASTSGTRRRFLRGMITHDLVKRGVSFDDAYAVAHSIRDRLSDRSEVSTSEIRDLIDIELESRFGESLPAEWRAPTVGDSPFRVSDATGERPFSRGLLARSLHAAGIGFDRAYRLVGEVEADLRADRVERISSGDLAVRAADLLERMEGQETARRFRLIRQIHHLPRPLVIYVGGATGTGKSTLALELAPLLRIYRINATDTIRQVMRIVFTPTILPALHSSTFELPAGSEGSSGEDRPGSPQDPEFASRLTASFEEQATRVCVGVRAVVERAIGENMSVVIEGTHLHPAIVPFSDLEGAAYQVPLVLATLDEEAHRTRFLARGRSGARRAERYLSNFASIRYLHDHLLAQAESHDRPLLDTSVGETASPGALRLVTGYLARAHPSLAAAEWSEPAVAAPLLLVIIDGVADRPVRALGGRTPLQAAATPTLDRLAREGRSGLADPIAPGVVADTAAGSLALFGQSPLALKRGPVEAVGAGVELRAGDVALRANFATLDEGGQVIDRRAGRIREGASDLAAALDRMLLPRRLADEVEIRVASSTEHRLAIVLRGREISSAIQGSDPGDGAAPGPPLVPRPEDPDDPQAVFTATVLGAFEQRAREVLAGHPTNVERGRAGKPLANAILTRGAGRIHRLLPLEEAGVPLRLACVSGDRTVLGLARWLGAETITAPEMTANLDTDVDAKFEAAGEALGRRDLVMLHLKGADIAAHDQRPDLKAAFIERVDAALGRLLERHPGSFRVAVASDHATLSESGQHAADPLPVVVWGDGVEPDDVEAYDEQSAAAGGLQRFPLQLLLGRLFDLG